MTVRSVLEGPLDGAVRETVVVEGHTDGIGEPVGKGANEPIAAEVDDAGEDLPEGRARNWRATLGFDR